MISEEDGDIDMDLPRKISAVYMCSIMVHILLLTTALEREDHVAKFRFKYLGIVEVSSG